MTVNPADEGHNIEAIGRFRSGLTQEQQRRRSRAERRIPILPVRASIGATSRCIVQQRLTEGLMLSLIAAALGLALAVSAVRAFLAASPNAPLGHCAWNVDSPASPLGPRWSTNPPYRIGS
jgi:hypothetical protein